ncbi:MAG: hypothetical protein AAFP16_15000 [Pseudomonadota bacterium]
MTFIRPEAKAALWRWREVLLGMAIAVLALWWLADANGVLRFVAPAVLVGAGALIMVGLQRGRFRNTGGGVGAVQVVEGQIIYYGPLSGGAVAVRDLRRLTLDARQRPAHWRLEQADQPPLLIPLDAEGAEALFDAFAALPGLRTERMLAHMRSLPETSVLVWERPRPTLAEMTPRGRA